MDIYAISKSLCIKAANIFQPCAYIRMLVLVHIHIHTCTFLINDLAEK